MSFVLYEPLSAEKADELCIKTFRTLAEGAYQQPVGLVTIEQTKILADE